MKNIHNVLYKKMKEEAQLSQSEEPPSTPIKRNVKKKGSNSELVVYIYNVVEDEWSFISAITDK